MFNFNDNDDELKTNVDALIGKTGIVTKKINTINQVGQVKIEGETWSALGENEMDIEKGVQIIVKKVKGVRLIVSPRNQR